jgi:NADH:ubiquinone oxidoreductase subunit 3 (subunit A)
MLVLQVFIPFLIFGVLAMLGGLLTLLMPETLGARMPEQVEVSGALYCMPRWASRA